MKKQNVAIIGSICFAFLTGGIAGNYAAKHQSDHIKISVDNMKQVVDDTKFQNTYVDTLKNINGGIIKTHKHEDEFSRVISIVDDYRKGLPEWVDLEGIDIHEIRMDYYRIHNWIIKVRSFTNNIKHVKSYAQGVNELNEMIKGTASVQAAYDTLRTKYDIVFPLHVSEMKILLGKWESYVKQSDSVPANPAEDIRELGRELYSIIENISDTAAGLD